VDAPRKKSRVISRLRRLLRWRQRFHALRMRNRVLRDRHARLFQRRLVQLRQEIAAQAEREGFTKFLDGYVAEIERRAVELALEHGDGDLGEAATLLGVSPDELQELIARHKVFVREKVER
jgi:DNA-binding NtrC family response regulator